VENDLEPRTGTERSLVKRIFVVLNAFETSESALSLVDLTVRTGLPKPTLHRLCKQLVDEGALTRTTGGGYRLGFRLFEIGSAVPGARNLRSAALPFLQDLHELTRGVVHLAVLEGLDVVYVDRVAGHRSPPVPSAIGNRNSAHSTSLGKSLLAFSEANTTSELMRSKLERMTPYTIVSPRLLREQLELIAKTGIAYAREEGKLGLSCVSAPIRGRSGLSMAAVSVCVPSLVELDGSLALAVARTARSVQEVIQRHPDSVWQVQASA
jgi:DNA-binding IclR family transcriptional regulator